MMETRQLSLFSTSDLPNKHTPFIHAIAPFQRYLRNEGKTANTITGFTSDLRLMCEYFGEEKPLGQFTTAELNRFMDWLENGRGKPCSRKSYARRVTTIKVFFKWLESERIRVDNPSKALLQRSGPAPLQTIVPGHELYQLLEFTTHLRFAKKPDSRPDLLVRLLLDTGLKKSECMNLTLQHIDQRDRNHPILLIRHKKKQNVYKERRIPLDPEWLDVLDEYWMQYEPKEFIFECTPRNLEYVLSDTATAAGLESRVSFEILRWTSAVHDYLRGMDLEELREKMGLSRVSWRETSAKIQQLARKEGSASASS